MSNIGLEQAETCLDRGDYDKCIEQLCTVVEALLASRIDSVIHLALIQQSWPDAGVRLLRTERGFCLVPLKTTFSIRDCQIWLGYAAILKNLLSGQPAQQTTLICLEQDSMSASRSLVIPRLKPAEMVWLSFTSLLRWSMTAEICWFAKIRLLRVSIVMKSAMAKYIPSHRAHVTFLADMIGFVFHEPRKNAMALLIEYELFLTKNYAKRSLYSNGKRSGTELRKAFLWRSLPAYQRYCHGDTRSRVLATIHMGDFAGAFRRIALESNEGRGVISLRRENPEGWTLHETATVGAHHRILQPGQYDPIQIIAALRKGRHTLAILFDLREDFGETIEVTFLGRHARFVKGPAQLAILGKATILPFVCYDEKGISVIEMADAIDTSVLPFESLLQATARVTQQLVCMAEKWVSRHPAQWKYMTSVMHYFDNDKAWHSAPKPVFESVSDSAPRSGIT